MAERQTQTVTQTADAVSASAKGCGIWWPGNKTEKKGGVLRKQTWFEQRKFGIFFVTNSPQISYQYE